MLVTRLGKKAKAFTQHYATDVLDSSLLFMPINDFISARDPMWLSTLDAVERELVSDGLVYRYNPAASPDGLHGEEGTFSLCTFLYVDALARSGSIRTILIRNEHAGAFAADGSARVTGEPGVICTPPTSPTKAVPSWR